VLRDPNRRTREAQRNGNDALFMQRIVRILHVAEQPTMCAAGYAARSSLSRSAFRLPKYKTRPARDLGCAARPHQPCAASQRISSIHMVLYLGLSRKKGTLRHLFFRIGHTDRGVYRRLRARRYSSLGLRAAAFAR
jgi:hypothetical protein